MKRWVRVLVGVAMLATVVVVLASNVSGELSAPEIRARLLSSGAWGPALFLLAFALLQPFGLSAHVFIVAAALVWPPAIAMGLSLAGALASSTVAFWFARWMGREWVQAKLPARLHRWDARLATQGFRTVLAMRLALFTFGPMQLMLGVSKVRFVSFLGASALGLLPLVALESFLGAGVIDWLRS